MNFLDYDFSVGRDWHDFIHPYVGQYGNGSRHRNRFWPAIDQQDWLADIANFQQFFTLPNNQRYYDVCYGPVHFFFLDSAVSEPDGKTSNSRQARWLQLKLMLSTSRWKIVVLASPPFSSDPNSQDSDLQWPFDEWGADLVISGTSFDYERFSVSRFPYIVNGLGGLNLFSPQTQASNSVALYAGNYGAGRVSVNKDTLRYEFFAIDGTLIDTLQITKGTSTMKPPIPSPSATGASSQVLHGPFSNPNSNITPPDTGSAALYYQDGVTPVPEWSWSVTNQAWYAVGGSGAGSNEDVVYVSDPNIEGLVPANTSQPCTAYSQSGSGPFYGWSVAQQKWV